MSLFGRNCCTVISLDLFEVKFHSRSTGAVASASLFTQETLSDGEADARFGVYLRCYESHWSLFADVLVCLERLSSMPLGIISNGNSDQQHQKLKRTGILERFSTVVISEEVGASKPEVSQRRLPLQALLGWLQVLSTALG